jgi:predicted transcriptional regulator
MIIHERQFIKPSKAARMLSILDALAMDSSQSQHALSQGSCLSGAMVNQYLREMQAQGLLRYVPANGKSFHYLLTEQGEEMRRRMFAEYSSELVRLYTAFKNAIMAKLQDLTQRGVRKVALFGASETCELALVAMRESRFEVVALVDNDPEKHGKIFHGQVISSPRVLEDARCQAIIVTTFGRQDEICAQVAPLARSKHMEIVRL